MQRVVADRGLLSLNDVDTLEALGREQGLAIDYIFAVPGRSHRSLTDIGRDCRIVSVPMRCRAFWRWWFTVICPSIGR